MGPTPIPSSFFMVMGRGLEPRGLTEAYAYGLYTQSKYKIIKGKITFRQILFLFNLVPTCKLVVLAGRSVIDWFPLVRSFLADFHDIALYSVASIFLRSVPRQRHTVFVDVFDFRSARLARRFLTQEANIQKCYFKLMN